MVIKTRLASCRSVSHHAINGLKLHDEQLRAPLMLANVFYYIVCIPLLPPLSLLTLLCAMPMVTLPPVLLWDAKASSSASFDHQPQEDSFLIVHQTLVDVSALAVQGLEQLMTFVSPMLPMSPCVSEIEQEPKQKKKSSFSVNPAYWFSQQHSPHKETKRYSPRKSICHNRASLNLWMWVCLKKIVEAWQVTTTWR